MMNEDHWRVEIDGRNLGEHAVRIVGVMLSRRWRDQKDIPTVTGPLLVFIISVNRELRWKNTTEHQTAVLFSI